MIAASPAAERPHRIGERHGCRACPAQGDSAPSDDLCSYGWRITMSHDQFDGLTRSLANTTSRRQMLKALAGGALAAAAAAGTLLKHGDTEAAAPKVCCTFLCEANAPGRVTVTECKSLVGNVENTCTPPSDTCVMSNF